MSKRRIALPLAAILLLAVVLAPIPGSTRWIGALHDTAHAPIFGFVAILLLIAARRDARLGRMPPWTGYVLAFCASALLGVATELAQIPMGRDATLSDAGRDVLGAFAFLVMFAAFDPVLQGRAHAFSRRIVLALLTLPLLFVAVKPGVDAAAAYARRAAQFPVLADFSARFDDYFIQPNWSVLTIASPAQKYARVGERALHVRFLPGPYPGVDLFEPAPDWSKYTALALDVTNPNSSPLELLLRVHDADHTNLFEDRFNKVLHVAPQTRATLRIALEEIRSAPRGRAMDLRRIAGVLFFKTDAASSIEEIYVTRIWLE
jgi:hypothetical protein